MSYGEIKMKLENDMIDYDEKLLNTLKKFIQGLN